MWLNDAGIVAHSKTERRLTSTGQVAHNHPDYSGIIQLNQQILDFLNMKIGMELLSIRSSDIAFTMGATGPLLERADNYEGEIPLY